jgi:glycosyltransferase involved in cell wall biosynthesis
LQRIRIVQVITRLIKGGAQKICLDLAESLPKDQYEVHLVSGPETGPEGSLWEKANQLKGISITVIPELVRSASLFKDSIALIKLYQFFRLVSPKIVHCHTSKAGFLGCLSARLANVPVVVFSPYGHLFAEDAQIPGVSGNWLRLKLFYFLSRLAGICADKIIAQNQKDKDDQIKLKLAPPQKYEVIYNSIELTNIPNSKFQIPNPQSHYPLLATIGRLSPEKGQKYLLEAIKLLKTTFPSVYLSVIGDGPLREELEDITEKLDIQDNVQFLGLSDNPRSLLKDIDIFVLPSLYESFGIVLLEAMAEKKPVIASKTSGIPDVVIDRKTGILVEPASADAIADAIIKLVKDKELAKKMGQAGYERLTSLFLKERMLNSFDALYKKLLTR